MADIFISYVREDIDAAAKLAEALEAQGWLVFWDRRIPAGKRFDDFLNEQLEAARCVIVLWSSRSIFSAWVRDEAAVGRDRGILVPAHLDDVLPPFGFRSIQSANLIGWQGDTSLWGFQKLSQAVRAAIKVAESAEEERQRREQQEAEAKRQAAEGWLQVWWADWERQEAERQGPAHPSSRKPWAGLKRALAFNREKRTPSVDQFVSDLRGGQIAPLRPTLIATGIVATFIVAAGVGYTLWPRHQQEPVTSTSAPLPLEAPRREEPAALEPEPSPQRHPEAVRPPQPEAMIKPAPPPAVTGPPARTTTEGGIFQDCPNCPQMIEVPLGSFQMGSRGEDPTEQPLHEVAIKRRFAIGVLEVTYGEWMACVKEKGCKYAPELPSATDRSPMRNVSWSDALQYTEWLKKTTHQPYRLPTEAEWEYVARANSLTRYWWGNEPGMVHANCKGCGGDWNREAPAQTGSFPPNSFGIYDMNGSVWEWVSDCWHGSYKGAPNDGSSWESPGCQQRVLRGGSWRDDPRLVRSSSRFYYDADIRYIANGFRVALSLD